MNGIRGLQVALVSAVFLAPAFSGVIPSKPLPPTGQKQPEYTVELPGTNPGGFIKLDKCFLLYPPEFEKQYPVKWLTFAIGKAMGQVKADFGEFEGTFRLVIAQRIFPQKGEPVPYWLRHDTKEPHIMVVLQHATTEVLTVTMAKRRIAELKLSPPRIIEQGIDNYYLSGGKFKAEDLTLLQKLKPASMDEFKINPAKLFDKEGEELRTRQRLTSSAMVWYLRVLAEQPMHKIAAMGEDDLEDFSEVLKKLESALKNK